MSTSYLLLLMLVLVLLVLLVLLPLHPDTHIKQNKRKTSLNLLFAIH